MIEARRRDSTTKRDQVRSAVERMVGEGTPITFAGVARRAGVSTWLVYAPGVRDVIENARTRQQASTSAEPVQPTGHPDLGTDLALARAEITRLRAERDQHQQQLRLALGSRLDNLAKADLLTRLDKLTAANTELLAREQQQQLDGDALQTRVAELEDDLAAARISLRRMIRSENLPTDPADPTVSEPTPALHRELLSHCATFLHTASPAVHAELRGYLTARGNQPTTGLAAFLDRLQFALHHQRD
jgi:hypothetical protein